jgi:hypothetical protein
MIVQLHHRNEPVARHIRLFRKRIESFLGGQGIAVAASVEGTAIFIRPVDDGKDRISVRLSAAAGCQAMKYGLAVFCGLPLCPREQVVADNIIANYATLKQLVL